MSESQRAPCLPSHVSRACRESNTDIRCRPWLTSGHCCFLTSVEKLWPHFSFVRVAGFLGDFPESNSFCVKPQRYTVFAMTVRKLSWCDRSLLSVFVFAVEWCQKPYCSFQVNVTSRWKPMITPWYNVTCKTKKKQPKPRLLIFKSP